MVWQAFRLWLPQQEVWAGGAMKQWPCCILYLVQAVWHVEWKHEIRNVLIVTTDHNPHWCSRQLSVLPLMFLKSLCSLSGCPVINICSCHKDRKLSWVGTMEYHAHAEFHYSNLLTYLCHGYSSFSNISGMDFGGSGYRQVVKWQLWVLETFCTQNYMVWEHASVWLAVCFVALL